MPESQGDFLQFLWWPDGDLTKDLEEYQMNVHLIGWSSSLSCPNFALQKDANEVEKIVGADTADVLKSFYVNNCLCSEESVDLAVERMHGVHCACAYGGFNLAKFLSNNKVVLESIPEEACAHEVRSLELGNNYYRIKRALSIQWGIESDMSSFRINIKEQLLTLRGILSNISSIYNPLGIAAPFLLVGKKI